MRSGSLKETNDRVRELFRQTVADMFGGVERIPESVLKAMKLEDYGKGKPLSARRINLVKAAVESFSANAAPYVEGARDWFARVDGITPEALDEAVMGKGGGKPTGKFKEQIRDHMERTGRSGFAMLQSILSTFLGDDKMKELPDDYKGVIPENFKMIVEDYAKDTRRQLGAQPKA